MVMLYSYSHGELVSMDDLQPFLEPDYRCVTDTKWLLLSVLNYDLQAQVACKTLTVRFRCVSSILTEALNEVLV